MTHEQIRANVEGQRKIMERLIDLDPKRENSAQIVNNADWLRVNQFFTEQVAYIADRLDRVQEGDRTLLDNSMILFCSSMMTGGHDNNQLPVVLLGRGGGRIQTGRVLDYSGRPNRKMCSLYLSLLDKAGVRLDRFGADGSVGGDERLPLAA